MQIKLVLGDITTLPVEAIVNAAEISLIAQTGGVDAAIHRAAGPELENECLKLGSCDTGDAKPTKAYGLPAKYVIHTVGPIWRAWLLKGNEERLLASCYRRSMEVADQLGCQSISFPAISTGMSGFPKDRAARIAVTEAKQFTGKIELLNFVCFDIANYAIYKALLAELPH